MRVNSSPSRRRTRPTATLGSLVAAEHTGPDQRAALAGHRGYYTLESTTGIYRSTIGTPGASSDEIEVGCHAASSQAHRGVGSLRRSRRMVMLVDRGAGISLLERSDSEHRIRRAWQASQPSLSGDMMHVLMDDVGFMQGEQDGDVLAVVDLADQVVNPSGHEVDPPRPGSSSSSSSGSGSRQQNLLLFIADMRSIGQSRGAAETRRPDISRPKRASIVRRCRRGPPGQRYGGKSRTVKGSWCRGQDCVAGVADVLRGRLAMVVAAGN